MSLCLVVAFLLLPAGLLVASAAAAPTDEETGPEEAGDAELAPPAPLSLAAGGEASASVGVRAGDAEETCLGTGNGAAGLAVAFEPECAAGDYSAVVTVRAADGADPGPRTVTLVATVAGSVVASADWQVTVGAVPEPTPTDGVPSPPPTTPPPTTAPPTTAPPVSPSPDGSGGSPDPDDPIELPGRLLANPPDRIRLGERAVVEVRISRELSADLTEDLIGSGQPQEEFLEVSALMSAKLTGGDDFRITALKKEEQFVSAEGFTEWAWEVEPLRSGSHSLFLTLSAYLSQDGGVSRDYPLREWTVDVAGNPAHSLTTFLRGNWQYLLTTMVGSGLLGLVLGRRGSRR